jgi:prefoldin subunit 5
MKESVKSRIEFIEQKLKDLKKMRTTSGCDLSMIDLNIKCYENELKELIEEDTNESRR